MIRAFTLAALLCSSAALATDYQRLEGHGGPVHALAIAPEFGDLVSGSFDNSVIIWRGSEAALRAVEHDAAVKVVHAAPGGLVIASGDDPRVIFRAASPDGEVAATVSHVLEGHTASVGALDTHVEGGEMLIASGSWDWRIGLWRATGEHLRWIEGHRGPVQAVAFSEDGGTLYSASTDGTIRLWDVATGDPIRIEVEHGFGVNKLILDEARGWLAYGALDGGVRILDIKTGDEIADITSGRKPVLALTQSRDGAMIAIGDGEGHIHILRTADWSTMRDFQATPRGPVWALAFTPDGAGIYAGSLASHIDLWPIETEGIAEATGPVNAFHRDPAQMTNGERQFYRKCFICHTLQGGTDRRAGPTLAGVFGRRAGTVDGYTYSDALDGSDLVWGAESLDKLFDIGPDFYTPGSKMPMQRITRTQDRADLVEFLRRATAPEMDGEKTQ